MPFGFFGVPVEGTSLDQTIQQIREGSVHWIVTANPEILLEAKRDKTYRDVLKQADLRIVDGFGLAALSWIFGHRVHRVTGVQLAERIVQESAQHGWKVAFIGGAKGTAERAKEMQLKKNPHLQAWAFDAGTVSRDGVGDEANDEALQQLTMLAPDVLLVAFGHPKQERWIQQNIGQFPQLKVAVGVGGTFDYWTGQVSRAPKWVQTIGMEWLFRLFVEPKRWRRIWNAVVIFPLVALFSKKKRSP